MKRACDYDGSQEICYLTIEDTLTTEDIVCVVFGFCTYEYLFLCAQVCKLWHTLSHRPENWPDISVVKEDVHLRDASFWRTSPLSSRFSLSAENAPQLNKRKFFLTYMKVASLLKKLNLGVEHVGPRFTASLIIKGLNYDKLNTVHLEHNELFTFEGACLVDRDFEDPEIQEPYWIFQTNGILKESREIYSKCSVALEKLKQFPGARLPKLVESTALIHSFLLSKKDGQTPYSSIDSHGQHMLTYCSEDAHQMSPGTAGLCRLEGSLSFICSFKGDPLFHILHREEAYGIGFVYDL